MRMILGICCGLGTWALAELIEARRRRLPHNAVGQNFQPEAHTLHHVDMVRSEIIVRADGNVEASCAFEGCRHRVLIGRDLARSWVECHPADFTQAAGETL